MNKAISEYKYTFFTPMIYEPCGLYCYAHKRIWRILSILFDKEDRLFDIARCFLRRMSNTKKIGKILKLKKKKFMNERPFDMFDKVCDYYSYTYIVILKGISLIFYITHTRLLLKKCRIVEQAGASTVINSIKTILYGKKICSTLPSEIGFQSNSLSNILRTGV